MARRVYRVDYQPEGEARETVIYDLSREAAMRLAARLSRKHGTAYAIARDDQRARDDVHGQDDRHGQDVGQRVYIRGAFSHQDDQF